jgi:hypothetical protein
MRQEIQLLLGSVFFLGLVFSFSFGVGALAGVNLPDGAACYQDNLACRWFRIRHPKMIL